MRRHLQLASIAILGCLLFMEIGMRIALRTPGFQPFPRSQPRGLLVPHELRGYAYAPGFAGTVTTPEYQIEIVTNSLGLRDDPVAAGDRIDILAVGDSFTVGFGVQAEDAWPSLLGFHWADQGAGRTRVLNAGISGYSLHQIRLVTEDLLSLEPELVVLGLYPSRYWRLANPYTYFEGYAMQRDRIPHLAVTDGGFLYSAFEDARFQRVHRWFMKNLHIGARFFEGLSTIAGELERASRRWEDRLPSSEEKLQPLLDELARIHELCEQRDVPLIVLLVNHQEVDGSFAASEREHNSIVASFAAGRGLSVFDPLPLLEASSNGNPVFRIGRDHHWSASAHALVAEELGAFLLREDHRGQSQ